MPGFSFRYRQSGGAPTIQPVPAAATATLTRGDMGNLVVGQVALGATLNANFLGAVQETKAGTAGVTKYEVVTDPDAVYGVTDANARKKGDTLDLAGATGAQAVAASVNKEFVVVADSSASEETLVRFNVGKHVDNKAQ